jgi:hypothetical protein
MDGTSPRTWQYWLKDLPSFMPTGMTGDELPVMAAFLVGYSTVRGGTDWPVTALETIFQLRDGIPSFARCMDCPMGFMGETDVA